MVNTNITDFRKNIFNIVEQTIKFNEPVNISTKMGNAVMISEEDYNGMVETLYLTSIPGMEKRLEDAIATAPDDYIPLSEVWPDV